MKPLQFPTSGGSYRRIKGKLIREEDAPATVADAPAADPQPAATEATEPTPAQRGRRATRED